MGLLEKVRDFFYDEEDYEEDIKPVHKEKKVKKEKIKINEIQEEKILPNEKQEISERELFKAERTFNFPMDIDDNYNGINKEKVQIDNIEENQEKKEEKTVIPKYIPSAYKRVEVKPEEKKEDNKFKPTPVISPIYGILDKNYKKEDLQIDEAKEEKIIKKLDYESVRRKAYSNMYTSLEKEEEVEESKGIFYNVPDEEEKEDVKIIYNDVTFDDDENDEIDDKNVTIGEKIEQYEKSLQGQDEEGDYEEDEDSQILSETREQDLFNLIDNMYNSEEDEEEEE